MILAAESNIHLFQIGEWWLLLSGMSITRLPYVTGAKNLLEISRGYIYTHPVWVEFENSLSGIRQWPGKGLVLFYGGLTVSKSHSTFKRYAVMVMAAAVVSAGLRWAFRDTGFPRRLVGR